MKEFGNTNVALFIFIHLLSSSEPHPTIKEIVREEEDLASSNQ